MYVSALASSFHGIIRMPITPVMSAAGLEARSACGARLAKSLAGLTTLAAMFTEMVAMPTPSSATTATSERGRRDGDQRRVEARPARRSR